MRHKRKILIAFFTMLCFFMVEKVYAANEKTNTACINGLYYELNQPILVKDYINLINQHNTASILSGANANSKNITLTYYENEGIKKYRKCYNKVDGNSFTAQSCNAKYAYDIEIANFGKENEQVLNTNNDTITLTLSINTEHGLDPSKLSFEIRYNGGSVGNISKANGNKITISNIQPNDFKEYDIYVYYNNPTSNDFGKISDPVDVCYQDGKRIYLTTLKTYIKNLNSFKYTTSEEFRNRDICVKARKLANEKSIREPFKACFDEMTIGYLQYKNNYAGLEKEITSKYNTIMKMFESDETIQTIDTKNLKCYNPNLGLTDSNQDALPIGIKEYEVLPSDIGAKSANRDNYWMMKCTEKYYVEASDPALVKAGQGVEYPNRVQVDRSCQLALLKTVHKKDQCTYSGQVLCQSSITGEWVPNAGPNASYDSCVEKCDGGKYTQSCINKCYNTIYKNENTKSIISSMKDITFSDYLLRKIENENLNGANSGVITPADHQGESIPLADGFTLEVGEHQDSGYNETLDRNYTDFIELYLYDNSGNKIATAYTAHQCLDAKMPCKFDVYKTSSDDCSDNPGAEYDAEITESRNQHKALYDLARSYVSGIENYEISFIDSENTQIYSVSGRMVMDSDRKNLVETITGVKLDITTDGNKEIEKNEYGVQIGNETTENKVMDFKTRVIYNINLPKQYVTANDANKIIVEGTNGYYEKVNDKSGTFKFKKTSITNAKELEAGANVYYTSLTMDDSNIKRQCEPTNSNTLNSSNTNTLMGQVMKSKELKEEYEGLGSKSKTTFYEYWLEHGEFYTAFSYNAYAAYIQNNNFIVKSLEEEYDNIKVSFEFTSLEDSYKQPSNIKHVSSKYDCYYGVYNMLKGGKQDNSCNDGGNGIGGGLRYYYHEINLDDIFDETGPNKRIPRWNWTGTITKDGKATGAAAYIRNDYIVDPERLIKSIESNGNKLYTDEAIQQKEIEYEYTMTNDVINKIRKYNSEVINIDGKKQKRPYTYFTLAVAEKTGDRVENYFSNADTWFGGQFKSREMSLSPCNNTISGTCYNYNIGGK